MTAARRAMDDYYAAEVSPPGRYGPAIATWLTAQLPGRDVRNIGWGLMLLAAMLLPDRTADSSGMGMRSALLSAGQVGVALIDSVPPQAAQGGPVGQDLAALHPLDNQPWDQLDGFFPPGLMDITKLTQTLTAQMAEAFPAADLPGCGWAALGTGVMLTKDLQEAHLSATRRLMLPRTRQRKTKQSMLALMGSVTLARVGDSLISQA
jgi:hypothetical protein